MADPLPLLGYRLAAAALRPLVPLWLDRRVARGKEDRERIGERFGHAGRPRPEGALVWCHAASLGESLSALPLLEAIAASGAQVLITTGTVTSARALAARGASGPIHQYAPLDHPAFVAAFLDHWRPDLALRVESEIWPHTLAAARARGLPMVAVNARLSPRAVRGWERIPAASRRVFGCLTAALAQSDADRDAFARLGAQHAETTGNMKAALPPLPDNAAARDAAEAMLGGRRRWLAASIHPGEAAIVARAHLGAQASVPGLATFIVPRHPDKASAMAAEIAALGLSVARRSLGETLKPDTAVYIADTFGELGIFYRLCPLVFVGKSLAVGGGQNPIEPAQLGCALMFGPDMSNFPVEAARFIAGGAALRLAGPEALSDAVARLLGDPATLAEMRDHARALAMPDPAPLNATLAALAPYLDRIGIR